MRYNLKVADNYCEELQCVREANSILHLVRTSGCLPPRIFEADGRLILNVDDGYEDCSMDLLDLINWIKENKPELLNGEGLI